MVCIHFTDSKPTNTGSAYAGAGKCHLLVDKVDVKKDDSGATQVVVDLKVLAHERPSEVGKKTTLRLPTTGKAVSKTLLFLLATGLTTMEDQQAIEKAGENKGDYDFPASFGRTICAVIEKSEYKGKTYENIGFKLYDPESPEAADFPKDMVYVTGGDDNPAF